MLGLTDYSRVLEKALSIAEKESKEQEGLAKEGKALTVSQFMRKGYFTKLDDQLYKLMKIKPISVKRIKYIRSHLDDFVLERFSKD